MTRMPAVFQKLRLPVIGSPLFIISNPALLIAQCRAGIVGAMPALNARPSAQLDDWLAEITASLAGAGAAPYAINLIAHKSNARLDEDLAVCEKHKVPIVITSLGAQAQINQAVHAWGGVTLHDVIHNTFARKAVEKGADGLIAVAAGAGGHAGTRSPFALVQEIRRWFDGPLVLSGSIATGGAILAAQAMGADLAYIGSPFIATREANASDAYKQAIVDASSDDIVYSNLFTGVHGNYLAASIRNAGLDPDRLPSDARDYAAGAPRPWKDIWGSGQGVGVVDEVVPAATLIDRLAGQYQAARARLSGS
ncbi:nitronate monooxygenase family protein [Bordetella sp. FB-8]|uniref:NAD(P)H-dependent flavin oxidoreductase n=1 Tax=Bordetella sp. FB-8 TaxID=1159870 RepID=UPI00039B9308|nr:nitronate monooxygenase family protein [Bordetella sp. FB-8]